MQRSAMANKARPAAKEPKKGKKLHKSKSMEAVRTLSKPQTPYTPIDG
jgi:hypothetical protein